MSFPLKLVYEIKRGRRRLGAVYAWSKGEVYLAFSTAKDVYRSGEKSNSDAVRAGIACWAIEEEILLKMRSRGLNFVGVLIKDTGEVWVSTISRFRKSPVTNTHITRSSAYKRYLPITPENFHSAIIA